MKLAKSAWYSFDGVDKIVHLSLFGLLSVLAYYSFSKYSKKVIFIWLIIFSILTEILQGILGWGRSCELLDLLADSLGILLGFYLLRFLK